MEEKPQTKEERIQEIKVWCEEVKSEKKKNCVSQRIKKLGNANSSESERCSVGDSIVVVNLSSIFDEGAMGYVYHFYNGKLFCYEEEMHTGPGNESMSFYFDRKGNLIAGFKSSEYGWEEEDTYKNRPLESLAEYSEIHLENLNLANTILRNVK